MTRRWTVLAMALAVGAVPAFADNARPRGGGGGGSSAGSSHHSGGGGGSSHHGGSGGGSSHSGSGGGPTGAQARHPRAGTGTGSHYYGYGHGYGHGYGYYGYPYYGYRPYYYGYGPYWYGYSPYFYGGYGYGYDGYGYDGYGGPAYSNGYNQESGALRTFVEPLETKVYVDGRYAGTADDFDGMMQRLYVSPGAHDIMLGLEGYKTHRVKVYVAPGATLKLHYDMAKGSGEDAQIDTLGNPEDERWGKRDRRYDDEDQDDDADRDEVRRDDRGSRDREYADDGGRDRGRPQAELSAREGAGAGGTVRLAVQPGDASIYVDGRFRGAAERLGSLSLSPGRHHIEVVRPGFRTVERDVDVGTDEDTTLEVELSKT